MDSVSKASSNFSMLSKAKKKTKRFVTSAIATILDTIANFITENKSAGGKTLCKVKKKLSVLAM